MSILKTKQAMEQSSIEAVAKQAIEHAKAVQPKLNAMVTICDYDDSHLAAVKQSSPLYGIPVVVKDNVSTKGIRTTASSLMLDNYVPVFDATVMTKLKQAGAILIGKSSMDELGMGGTNKTAYTGPVHNPYDLSRISGGSSGGSAAIVAAGVVPVSIGTDTGDSIRKPASYCNIVGVKPTYGRISRYGVIPYASSLDHVGYFTRNVKDAAIMLGVLAGRDDHDLTSSDEPVSQYAETLNGSLNNKRIAVLSNVIDSITDTTVVDQFNILMDKAKAAGARVDVVHLDDLLMKALLPVYFVIANAEATANHSNLDGIRFGLQEEGESVEDVMMKSRTKGLSSFIRQRLVVGSYALFTENQEKVLRKAQKVRRLIVNEVEKILREYDGIVTIAAASGAPLIESSASQDKLSSEYLIAENHLLLGNFTGFPGMTLPLGVDKQGLPIGLNVMCKAFDEQMMFDLAQGLEDLTGLNDQIKEVVA